MKNKSPRPRYAPKSRTGGDAAVLPPCFASFLQKKPLTAVGEESRHSRVPITGKSAAAYWECRAGIRSVRSSGRYFAVAVLAPLINRVLSVSRVRLLFPVKAYTNHYYRLRLVKCQVKTKKISERKKRKKERLPCRGKGVGEMQITEWSVRSAALHRWCCEWSAQSCPNPRRDRG